MTYKTSLELLNNLYKFNISNNIKPNTDNIINFLNKIDNPEKNLKYIHVAGTNGKGSVCFMLSNILREAGYKTGLYISPHIYNIRERIQVNNKLISEKDFADLTEYLYNCCLSFKINLTYFEFLTVLSFLYFNKHNCDIVVLETGLGGKYDATNVIKNNICSVITSISLDHTQILGNNIQKITLEKAGIIKPNSCTIIGPNQKNIVYQNIKKVCDLKNNKFVISNSNKIKFKTNNFNLVFNYKNLEINTKLTGEYQKENICTVLTVLEEIFNIVPVSKQNIKNSLEKLCIPCRMQIINTKPLIILDAAHNISGAEKLKLFIKNDLKNQKITAIIGIFKDKDVNNILKELSGCFNKIITIQSNSERAMNIEDLTKLAKLYFTEVFSYYNINNLKNILNKISDQEIVIIFGSFSIMEQFKSYLF